MPPALPPREHFRRGLWAVFVFAVVAVGTLTGAQLKMDKSRRQAVDEFRETSPAEQIAILDAQKKALQQQKAALEKRVDLFRERVRDRESRSGKGKQ